MKAVSSDRSRDSINRWCTNFLPYRKSVKATATTLTLTSQLDPNAKTSKTISLRSRTFNNYCPSGLILRNDFNRSTNIRDSSTQDPSSMCCFVSPCILSAPNSLPFGQNRQAKSDVLIESIPPETILQTKSSRQCLCRSCFGLVGLPVPSTKRTGH